MRARLALSAALHSDADVLLMDEVLAVGDQEFREDALQRVKELAREGTAVVLIALVLAVNSLSIGLRVYLRSRKKW